MEMGTNGSAQNENKIIVGFNYKIQAQIKSKNIHLTSAPKSTALLSEFALHVFMKIVALEIIWNMRQKWGKSEVWFKSYGENSEAM